MVVAFIALGVALGGTGYAVTALPRNSVGGTQIRTNAVGPSEIRARAVGTSELRDRSIRPNDLAPGVAVSGPQGPAGPQGEQGPPGPATGAAGGALTGSYPNPGLANGAVRPANIAGIPSARIEQGRTDDQTITSGGGFSNLQYQVERYDTDNMADLSGALQNERLTIRTPGVYLVTAAARWDPDTDGTPTGVRSLGIVADDDFLQFLAADTRASSSGSEATRQSVSAVERFVANQFVVAKVQQSSGAPLDVDNNDSPQVHLSATWLGP